jgi:hypothetical protein
MSSHLFTKTPTDLQKTKLSSNKQMPTHSLARKSRTCESNAAAASPARTLCDLPLHTRQGDAYSQEQYQWFELGCFVVIYRAGGWDRDRGAVVLGGHGRKAGVGHEMDGSTDRLDLRLRVAEGWMWVGRWMCRVLLLAYHLCR